MGSLHFSSLCLSLLFFTTDVLGCSRMTYNAGAKDSNRVIIGRSMDWLAPTNSSIWAFPAGMKRNGAAGSDSVNWTSKYGSVITSAYEEASADGINTQGLTANLLYLADGDYGARNTSKPAMSLSAWMQYFLDMYASCEEAANDVYDNTGHSKFQVRTEDVLPGVASLMHVALADATGDNLILEWLNGKLVIHHDKSYNVMTNEPDYDQQLAISTYWQDIANYSLPGTDRPADRFARLAHYLDVAPTDSTDLVTSMSTVAGMVRAVSVPLQPTSLSNPNIAPTLWRTYADTLDKRYYYESATDGTFFWVDLADLNLNSTGQVMKLDLMNVDWTTRLGDMKGNFKPATAFKFMEADN